MNSRTVISTPYPSVESVASELGVSKRRVEELRQLVRAIVGTKPRRVKSRGRSTVRGKKRGGSRRSRR